MRPDGTDLRPVRGVGDDDRGAVSLDRWTHTGSVVAITESDYDTTTAWLVDVESDQRQRLGSGHALQILDVSRDRRRALLRRGRRGSRHVGIVDLDGTEGWHEIDAGAAPAGRPAPSSTRSPSPATRRWSPRASPPTAPGCCVLTDGGRERAALVAVDVATDARPMFPEVLAERVDAELEQFALTEDAATAALVWNVAGRSELDLLDLATGKPAPYSPPGAVVTSAIFSHDGDSLVLGVQSPDVPSAVWCHELSSRTTALICPQDDPVWAPGTLVHPTLETVDDPRRPRPARLALPPARRRRAPAHRDLPARRARGAGAPGLHPALPGAARGTGSPCTPRTCAARRASAARSSTPTTAPGASPRSATSPPARSTSWRPGSPTPSAIGVMGRSYGGYLTLAALVNHPELFAVGVDVCGMADFETFFARTEPWIADAAVGEYGHPIHDRNLLRELSPVHRMDRLRAPLLVVHGRYDTNVPVHEAELAVHGAKAAGVDVRYLLFDDEGHEIQRLENRRTFIHAVTDWLTDHFDLA